MALESVQCYSNRLNNNTVIAVLNREPRGARTYQRITRAITQSNCFHYEFPWSWYNEAYTHYFDFINLVKLLVSANIWVLVRASYII